MTITLEELRKNQFKYRKILDDYCKEHYKDSQSCQLCLIRNYECSYFKEFIHIKVNNIFSKLDKCNGSYVISDSIVLNCLDKISSCKSSEFKIQCSNEPKKDNDAVKPKHYNGNVSLSCIDIMCVTFGLEETCHFCLCNSFKYLWRYKDKNGEEDIKKAKWYLDYVKNNYADKELNTEKNTEILKHHSRLCDLYSFVCDTYNKD